MNRQTFQAKPGQVAQNWLLVDATDQTLGRLSSKLATIIMGKHKPEYTPQTDTGDFVVIINAEKIKLTGNKADHKFFQTYSGYPGGQKRFSYRTMIADKPELLIERSVRRMLPRNKLSRHMLDKLKIYRGTEHPHQAQQPVPTSL
ncbi:MAG: 50S ribosomal protein L13 [Planctomycetes bacterium]|nr:50S ribosomal protein L13 [Planctomycetota bacterium]